MRMLVVLALLISPAYAQPALNAKTDCNGSIIDPKNPQPPNPPCKKKNRDCNGDWIDVLHPKPPNPPCPESKAPEMSDFMAAAFVLGALGIVWRIRKPHVGKDAL